MPTYINKQEWKGDRIVEPYRLKSSTGIKIPEHYRADTTDTTNLVLTQVPILRLLSVSYSMSVILFGTLFATLNEVRRDLEDVQKVKNWLVSVVLLIMLINWYNLCH